MVMQDNGTVVGLMDNNTTSYLGRGIALDSTLNPVGATDQGILTSTPHMSVDVIAHKKEPVEDSNAVYVFLPLIALILCLITALIFIGLRRKRLYGSMLWHPGSSRHHLIPIYDSWRMTAPEHGLLSRPDIVRSGGRGWHYDPLIESATAPPSAAQSNTQLTAVANHRWEERLLADDFNDPVYQPSTYISAQQYNDEDETHTAGPRLEFGSVEKV